MNRGLHVFALALLALASIKPSPSVGQPISTAISATQDTFTRQQDPDATFGVAGGLHISGAGAGNGQGVQQGVSDAWLMFDSASAAIGFDAAFGQGEWTLTAARLTLDEVGAPGNAIFNRGVGEFSVNWVANDNWNEPQGKPNSPGEASGTAIGFAAGQMLLNDNVDERLSTSRNQGEDGSVEIDLSVTPGFEADVAAGGLVTLYLAAADAVIGFTFHSRNWQNSLTGRPVLTLSAGPQQLDDASMDSDDDAPVDDEDSMDDEADVDNADDNGVDDDTDTDDGVVDNPSSNDGSNDSANGGDTGTVDESPTADDGEGGVPGTAPFSLCGNAASGVALIVLSVFPLMRLRRRPRHVPRA